MRPWKVGVRQGSASKKHRPYGQRKNSGYVQLDEVCALGGDIEEGQMTDCITLQPDDAINIQFTSGTTGNPKGATLGHSIFSTMACGRRRHAIQQT